MRKPADWSWRRLCRLFAWGAGLIAASLSFPAPTFGAEPPVAFGAGLKKALARHITATWQGQGLRRAAARLVEEQAVGLLLDRRLDPDRTISLALSDESIQQGLSKLAAAGGGELCLYADLAYIGPPESARELRTLAELRLDEARQAPKPRSKVLLAKKPWQWDDFAEPRALIEACASEAGLRPIGLEQVPHDLWAAARLPPMSAVQRLTLVLAQFDLTFRLNDAANELRVEPIARPVRLARTYAAGADLTRSLEKFRRLAPDCEVASEAGKIVVRGRLEDHERLATSESSSRPQGKGARPKGKSSAGVRKSVAPPRQVHTLAVRDAPLRAVLEKLKADLSLELQIDEASLERQGASLETRVTFSVERASLEELLSAATKGANVKFKLTDKRLEIFAE